MLFNVSHENVDVVVDSKLVLEVVARVRYQVSVTRLDQLVVLGVVVSHTVDALLDNLKGDFRNIETLQHPLVFLVRLCVVIINIEYHELLYLSSKFILLLF